MSARTAVQRGRLAARALMVDTAVVTRPGGPSTLNTSTGVLADAAATTVHEGPCRLREPTAQPADAQFGEQHVTISRFVVCFPHDTTGIDIGDLISVTVTADPDVVGRVFRVVAVPSATYTIYKAYPVEVVE